MDLDRKATYFWQAGGEDSFGGHRLMLNIFLYHFPPCLGGLYYDTQLFIWVLSI